MLHEDVTELHLRARRAEERALRDPLTGLPNRRLFLDRLGQALRRAERAGGRAGGAGVLLADLDGFKAVNDRHGHAAGDALLRLVGRRMAAALRGGDTVARLGGDEFAAVLPDLAGTADGAALGARLLAACQRPAAAGGATLRPRLSAGLAVAPGDGRDAAALLACADRALYRAKAAGGGRRRPAAAGSRSPRRATARGRRPGGGGRRDRPAPTADPGSTLICHSILCGKAHGQKIQ